MCPIKELSLDDLVGHSSVFWSQGNAPTQEVYSINSSELRMHFIGTYLLSDKIVAAASFYYESNQTRSISLEFSDILNSGDVLYFVDDSIENFNEHARKKARKSPRSFTCYQDQALLNLLSQELNAFGHILRRPDVSISTEIAILWQNELSSIEPGTLGGFLYNRYGNAKLYFESLNFLKKICEERGKNQFVWPYLEPLLKKFKFSPDFLRFAKRKLAQYYAIATSQLLKIPLDTKTSTSLDSIVPSSRFDTSLFLEVMDVMGLKDAIAKLNVAEIVQLKLSSQFLIFKKFYFSLIEAAYYNISKLAELVHYYVNLEKMILSKPSQRDTIVSAFKNWCHNIDFDRRKTSKALQLLLSAYDAFGHKIITDFHGLILNMSPNTVTNIDNGLGFFISSLNDNISKPKEKSMANSIFIGHGRSRIWIELKDFLTGRLNLCVEEFNRIPTAGVSTQERLLEMLENCSLAFLILTAEDEHTDGSTHARENVIHEVGLFQGKYGFKRAIVLLEEGCQEFSNIAGLGQIRFPPEDMMSKSEEIRRVLERENFLP